MNTELDLTLETAVEEVLGLLTGLDLSYDPTLDRFRAITRQLNRALRSNALEHEWSYYSEVITVGQAVAGERTVSLTDDSSRRVRVIGDDAVRLVDEDGWVVLWAYFLPRDALHKYQARPGMWASVTNDILTFSQPFTEAMAGLDIQVPVMREPLMFRLPEIPEDPDDPLVEVPQEILEQSIDFCYPDVVTLRAAYYYAQTDPVMQPRVQTLEAQYKDLMYQAIERDDRATDSPLQNNFVVPVQNGIYTPSVARPWPLSDRRR